MTASRGLVAVVEALGTHPSTTTRMCDRLLARCLIRRTVVRGNRRETQISLTSKGRDIVQRVTEIRRAEIARIVQRIAPEARESAIGALQAFADAAGELPQHAWSLGWSW